MRTKEDDGVGDGDAADDVDVAAAAGEGEDADADADAAVGDAAEDRDGDEWTRTTTEGWNHPS